MQLNISINDTVIEGLKEVCNATFFKQLSDIAINEFWKEASKFALIIGVYSIVMLGLGWFLADWFIKEVKQNEK